MDLELVGWPADGPTLALDHERFAYAGKFRMSSTGKAVGREATAVDTSEAAPGDGAGPGGGDVVAAAAFNADRTDETVCWIRYITVRDDRRGEGLGPELARFVVERARSRGFEEVRIAVNNPYAFEAVHRAGFGYTGETTGIAELVCSTAARLDAERYRDGMASYAARDAPWADYAAQRATGDPPAVDG